MSVPFQIVQIPLFFMKSDADRVDSISYGLILMLMYLPNGNYRENH